MSSIKIQATIGGYAGNPCTLYSLFDRENHILTVAKIGELRIDRFSDSTVITNVPTVNPRDAFFDERETAEAIRAFRHLFHGRSVDGQSAGLVFGPKAGQANPDAVIENDGVDIRGIKYRIEGSITCAQVACLATCFLTQKLDSAEAAIKMVDEVNDLYDAMMRGDIVTI